MSAGQNYPVVDTVLTGISYIWKRLRQGRKQSRARWLLPFVVVAGYVATFNHFEAFAVEYAVLSVFSFFSCCLLLTQMNRSLQITLPFWVMLTVFLIGYYVKIYWIAAFPDASFFYDIFNIDVSSTDALFSAFTTTTYSFVVFCFVAWVLLGMSRDSKRRAIATNSASESMLSADICRVVSSVALWISILLILVTTYILRVSGIAVMGVEGESLPFHFAGIVFYTRSVFIPAMLLLLIWCSQKARLSGRTMVGIALLVGYGLSDMILRSSRSGLATLLLSLAFLVLISKRGIRRIHALLFAGGVVLISLLFPFVSEYRNLRIDTGSVDIISLLVETYRNLIGGDPSIVWDILKIGIGSIIFRITGVDILIVFNSIGVEPIKDIAWSILTSSRGLSGYITVDIFGFSPDAVHAMAPGLVGWFYLIGGNVLAIVGIAWFTSTAYILWRMLNYARLKCLPVAQALFLSLFSAMVVDGTLDNFFTWQILVWPASIAVCEWIIRGSRRLALERFTVVKEST